MGEAETGYLPSLGATPMLKVGEPEAEGGGGGGPSETHQIAQTYVNSSTPGSHLTRVDDDNVLQRWYDPTTYKYRVGAINGSGSITGYTSTVNGDESGPYLFLAEFQDGQVFEIGTSTPTDYSCFTATGSGVTDQGGASKSVDTSGERSASFERQAVWSSTELVMAGINGSGYWELVVITRSGNTISSGTPTELHADMREDQPEHILYLDSTYGLVINEAGNSAQYFSKSGTSITLEGSVLDITWIPGTNMQSQISSVQVDGSNILRMALIQNANPFPSLWRFGAQKLAIDTSGFTLSATDLDDDIPFESDADDESIGLPVLGMALEATGIAEQYVFISHHVDSAETDENVYAYLVSFDGTGVLVSTPIKVTGVDGSNALFEVKQLRTGLVGVHVDDTFWIVEVTAI